jgi:hypothetical protein
VKYHPVVLYCLTTHRHPVLGPSVAGSLTGAVASQRVTEAREGGLRPVGNRLLECNGISPPDCETDKSSRDESRS